MKRVTRTAAGAMRSLAFCAQRRSSLLGGAAGEARATTDALIDSSRLIRNALTLSAAFACCLAASFSALSSHGNDYVPEHEREAAYLSRPKLAIIVDDMGYSMDRGERVLRLPGPITLAILPFTPVASELAEATVAVGKEVIVHQPMEPHRHRERAPASGLLTTAMSADAFRNTLRRSLESVPHSVGISNHTGSRLTEHDERMGWVMATLAEEQLFFVDSRTTAQTVAHRTALDWQVPSVSRDVFLDHELNETAIERAFERALRLAHLRGHAVLIAHPHDMSLRFLEQRLPDVVARGEISLVPASRLVSLRQRPAALALH